MPLLVAIASILNTFTLVWALTYVTDVSLVVQFLIALVGLGIAIDYALLMIFRFREELRHGNDVETSLVDDDAHAGRSVIVSGSTVAVGLLSMLVLPLPFIRSIGIGGMLIPAVSVLAAITLLPAMLARARPADQQRARAAEAARRRLGRRVAGFWNRWSRFVTRRPLPVAITGLAIVGVLLFYGAQLNPSEAQPKDLPGAGDAINGRAALDRGRRPAPASTSRSRSSSRATRRPAALEPHRSDSRLDAGCRRRDRAGAVAHARARRSSRRSRRTTARRRTCGR